MLFVDFSSVPPMKHEGELYSLGFSTTLCSWILNFCTSRPQILAVSPPLHQSRWSRWTGCTHWELLSHHHHHPWLKKATGMVKWFMHGTGQEAVQRVIREIMKNPEHHWSLEMSTRRTKYTQKKTPTPATVCCSLLFRKVGKVSHSPLHTESSKTFT